MAIRTIKITVYRHFWQFQLFANINQLPTLSLFNFTGIQGRESETGVFRGCGIIPDYLGDYCEWYIAELAIFNIPVVSCGGCDSNRCNNHTFDLETGQIIGVASWSGENRISSSSLSIILSVLTIGLIKF